MNISDVNNDGIGMDGMDIVSHYEGQPMRGNNEFQSAVGNVTYLFSSAKNVEKFEADPAKYIPTAGGYPVGTNVAPPEIQEVNGQVVGNKTFAYRKGLEDSVGSTENNVPTDIKEDGSVEMQNLSDSDS